MTKLYLGWEFSVIQDESAVVIGGVFHHVAVRGVVPLPLHHSEEHVAVPPAVLDGVGSVARDLERAVHAPETLLCCPIGEHEVGKVSRLKYVSICSRINFINY